MTKVLSILIYGIVRLLHATYRFRYINKENLEKAKSLSKNGNYLLGIWHQNLFSGILAQTGLHYVVIVSKSKDAEPVAFTCRSLGHKVVRGSSRKGNVDKGGKAAKDEMIEVLKSGLPGSVTVDGPKGPAKKVKPGIIDMARKSGAPLVAYSSIAESYWEFNSWDKFRLPKPFSRIVISYGEPLLVPQDCGKEDFESIALKHEQLINENDQVAEAAFSNWNSLSKENTH